MNEIFPSLNDRDMSEFESHGKLNGFFFRKHHVRIRALHVDKLKTVIDFVDEEFSGEIFDPIFGIMIASDLRLPFEGIFLDDLVFKEGFCDLPMKQFLNDECLNFSNTQIRVIGVFFEEDLQFFDLSILIDEVLGKILTLYNIHVIFLNDFGVLRFLNEKQRLKQMILDPFLFVEIIFFEI